MPEFVDPLATARADRPYSPLVRSVRISPSHAPGASTLSH